MAQIYGGRWKRTDARRLGKGGQSEVYRVVDTRGEHAGEFALKRVINPKRNARFRNEVAAITRLKHPNIVTLIDHSALDDAEVVIEKQFLVMPIATGGDLSDPGRVALYKDNIDGLLTVALEITSALAAAHEAGVIHRDVKPQNILFTGMGHDTRLADFGICLLREETRVTPADEVVGPRAFMAPELEDGGQLEVTPAADVYSLGKVIFYMLSGGMIVPRERLHEGPYQVVFAGGERHRLLELLLAQMICPLASRIQTMDEVSKKLTKIQEWEKNATLLPVSKAGRAALEKIKQRSLTSARILSENAQARDQEANTITRVRESIFAWWQAELAKMAAELQSLTTKAGVEALTIDTNNGLRVQVGDRSFYDGLTGIKLTFEDTSDPQYQTHELHLWLCRRSTITITATSGHKQPQPVPTPPRDQVLAFLPMYRRRLNRQAPSMSAELGYLSKPDAVGKPHGIVEIPRGRNRGAPIVHNLPVTPVMHAFYNNVAQHIEFRASEWPGNTEHMQTALQAAIEAHLAIIGQ